MGELPPAREQRSIYSRPTTIHDLAHVGDLTAFQRLLRDNPSVLNYAIHVCKPILPIEVSVNQIGSYFVDIFLGLCPWLSLLSASISEGRRSRRWLQVDVREEREIRVTMPVVVNGFFSL